MNAGSNETDANQDNNSANEGDIIKHCSLADVLNHCAGNWDSVHFSETHAGAGKYSAKSQVAPKKNYIEQLKAKVLQSCLLYTSDAADE